MVKELSVSDYRSFVSGEIYMFIFNDTFVFELCRGS